MPKKSYLILPISIALLLAPVFVFAENLSLATCYPDALQQNQQCPFDPNQGQTQVHIKWDMSNQFSGKAWCVVEKWTANPPSYEGGWSTFASRKNSSGFSSFGPTDNKFKPQDDIMLKNPTTGGVYRTTCCVANDNDNPIGCKSGSPRISSPTRTIVGSVPCESSFASIVDSLNNNQATKITENDFKSWSGAEDSKDFANWPSDSSGGSGDKRDIKSFMLNTQCLPGVAKVNLRDQTVSNVSLASLKSLFDSNGGGNPLPLFYFHDSGLHVTILVGITKNSSTDYTLRVLDSENIGAIREFSCRPTEIFVPNTGEWMKVTRCVADNGQEVYLLDGNHASFQYHTNLQTLINNKVRSNPAGWVETNHSDFPNFTSTNCVTARNGVCAGWVDFNLRVAYLGEFSGADYNPGDGKIVGRDCDANRKPITKPQKSAWLDPINWSANIYGLWASWGAWIKW